MVNLHVLLTLAFWNLTLLITQSCGSALMHQQIFDAISLNKH